MLPGNDDVFHRMELPSDRSTVCIENKIFSSEGDGQLGKCLRSDLSYLAFLTAYEARVADEVWEARAICVRGVGGDTSCGAN